MMEFVAILMIAVLALGGIWALYEVYARFLGPEAKRHDQAHWLNEK